MITVELCRKKAAECEAVAERITDLKQKTAMLQTAQWWLRLAIYEEEQGSRGIAQKIAK
jgi:hypothetical protein